MTDYVKKIIVQNKPLRRKIIRAESLKILGLTDTATEEEIKRAYRQKALEHHPDKNHNDPQATERFQNLKEAYQTLVEEEQEKDVEFNMFDILLAMGLIKIRPFPFGFHDDRRFYDPYSDYRQTSCTCGRCDRRQPRNPHRTDYFEDETRNRNYFSEQRHNPRNFQTAAGTRKANSETMSSESIDDDWLAGLIPSGDTQQYGTKQKQSSKKKKGKQKKKSNSRKWTKIDGKQSSKDTSDKKLNVTDEKSENERENADEATKSSKEGQTADNQTRNNVKSQKTKDKSTKTSDEKFDNQVPGKTEQEKSTSAKVNDKREQFVAKNDISKKEHKNGQEQSRHHFMKTQQSPDKDTDVKQKQTPSKTGVDKVSSTKNTPFVERKQQERNTNSKHTKKISSEAAQTVNLSKAAQPPKIACKFQNCNHDKTPVNSQKVQKGKSVSKQANSADSKKTISSENRGKSPQQNIDNNMPSKQNRNNKDKTEQEKTKQRGHRVIDNSQCSKHATDVNMTYDMNHCQKTKITSTDGIPAGSHSNVFGQDNKKQLGKKQPATNDDTLKKDKTQQVVNGSPVTPRTQNNSQQPGTYQETLQKENNQPRDGVKQKIPDTVWTPLRSNAPSHEHYAYYQQSGDDQKRDQENTKKSFKANRPSGSATKANIHCAPTVPGPQQFPATKEPTKYNHPSMYTYPWSTIPVQEQTPYGVGPINQERHQYQTEPLRAMHQPSIWGNSTASTSFLETFDGTGYGKTIYQEASANHTNHHTVPGRNGFVWTAPPVQEKYANASRTGNVQEETKRPSTTTTTTSDYVWYNPHIQENETNVRNTNRKVQQGNTRHTSPGWFTPSVRESLVDVRDTIRSFQEGFKDHTKPVMSNHDWVPSSDNKNSAVKTATNFQKESTSNSRPVTTENGWTTKRDQENTSAKDFVKVYYPLKTESSTRTQCYDCPPSSNMSHAKVQLKTEHEQSTSLGSPNSKNISKSGTKSTRKEKQNTKKQKKSPRSAGFLITLK